MWIPRSREVLTRPMAWLVASARFDVVQWLSNGAVAALVGGLVGGYFTLRAQRVASSVESRRVSIEEFQQHKDFYEAELARRDKREDQLQEQLNRKGAEIDALRREVRELRFELGRPV